MTDLEKQKKGVELIEELCGDVARMSDHAERTGRSHILTKAIAEKQTLIDALETLIPIVEGKSVVVPVDELSDLKGMVVSFAGPRAGEYAKLHGLKNGELHPVHYDILKKCGARMDDFKPAMIKATGE